MHMAAEKRITFTFARATTAGRVRRLAQERGCTVQDVINEAVEQYLDSDVTHTRALCDNLVAQQSRLIALLERESGVIAPTLPRAAPKPALSFVSDMLPPPIISVPERNPWG
jgi:hypothetical protein